MAPLLKKVRDNVLQNKGMKNYFKYAVGETILVVVGILIALYIKGWYSEIQEEDHISKVGSQIIEDLRTDTTMIGSIIQFYEPKEEIYKQVLSDSMSIEDFKACKFCTSLVSILQPFSPNQNGYSLLKNFDTDLKTSKDTLIHKTKLFYAQTIPMIELLNEMIKDDVTSNLKDWKNNQHWYSKWINGEIDEKYYEYMANDPLYKNKVANFYLLLYKNYINGLKAYSMQANELADQWSEAIDNSK